MMKLPKRIEKILENYDFSICGEITQYRNEKDYNIELETYSPLGEDVIVSFYFDGTKKGFIKAFEEYADNFDVDDHVGIWIDSRGKNGVPGSIRDLLEDAEWQKNIFLEIAGELNNL